MARHSAAALACAVLLAVSAVAFAAEAPKTPAVAGIPRKPANPAAKTESFTAALSDQPDLSSFRALLKFIGADDELTAATDADIIVFAPTNAALDAFAKEMTGDAKATAKDLLQEKYVPLLAHVASAHVTEDDDDNGIYNALGGQTLLVSGSGDDAERVAMLPSNKSTANILREEDLGEAGDLYVIDRVLKPDDVYASPADAFKADPELATYGRLVTALAPELVSSVNAGAPSTVFVPTSAALNKYLTSAGLTEAKLLAASPDVKAQATGTLVYHVVPGIALDTESLVAGGDWKLDTTLVVGPKPSGAKFDPADVVKTLKASSTKDGAVIVQGDLSKAKAGSQVYAGADVFHKIDNVLVPSVKEGTAAKKPSDKVVAGVASANNKAAVVAGVAAAAPVPMASTGRKLMRSAARNNMVRNTQRANIRRAMNGTISVAQATRANNNVAALAPYGRVPNFFLTQSGTRGGFLV